MTKSKIRLSLSKAVAKLPPPCVLAVKPESSVDEAQLEEEVESGAKRFLNFILRTANQCIFCFNLKLSSTKLRVAWSHIVLVPSHPREEVQMDSLQQIALTKDRFQSQLASLQAKTDRFEAIGNQDNGF